MWASEKSIVRRAGAVGKLHTLRIGQQQINRGIPMSDSDIFEGYAAMQNFQILHPSNGLGQQQWREMESPSSLKFLTFSVTKQQAIIAHVRRTRKPHQECRWAAKSPKLALKVLISSKIRWPKVFKNPQVVTHCTAYMTNQMQLILVRKTSSTQKLHPECLRAVWYNYCFNHPRTELELYCT